jgi:hypothetical protein
MGILWSGSYCVNQKTRDKDECYYREKEATLLV